MRTFMLVASVLGFATHGHSVAAGPCDTLPAYPSSAVYVSNWTEAQIELSKTAQQIATLSQCVREQQKLIYEAYETLHQQNEIIDEFVLRRKPAKR